LFSFNFITNLNFFFVQLGNFVYKVCVQASFCFQHFIIIVAIWTTWVLIQVETVTSCHLTFRQWCGMALPLAYNMCFSITANHIQNLSSVSTYIRRTNSLVQEATTPSMHVASCSDGNREQNHKICVYCAQI